MDLLLYVIGRTLIAFLQALPLPWVAWLGRTGGALAFRLDGRHRKVAVRNLTMCFGKEKSPVEIAAIARENFRRIGETYASAIKTAVMSRDAILPHFTLIGAEKVLPHQANAGPQNRMVAIGHFGNFELYTRLVQFMPGFQGAATYRALGQPSLNRLMQSLRERSGCKFFERRSESAALRAAFNDTGLLLGLLSDQHAGRTGLRLPFLGHECSTSAAPAVFALRYNCPLHTGICYRVGPARWQIEMGDAIPTRENGQPRTTEAIMRDVNLALETAVRRDPANWFWVHDRWKPLKQKAGGRGTRKGTSPGPDEAKMEDGE